MKDQHTKIKGYRDLSQAEIDLMNQIKAKGEELARLADDIFAHLQDQTVAAMNIKDDGERAMELTRIDAATPNRWVSIAKTDLQTGLMALTRAVAQPTTF